jgi:phosphomannomutase
VAGSTQQVHPTMSPSEMKAFYLEQTLNSLEHWEQNNFKIQGQPPFGLGQSEASSLLITPELAKKLNLRKQITEFAEEAKVSTAGVRENQNVLCPWDHRYRINEYIFALIAEAISRLVKELHPQRMATLAKPDVAMVAKELGAENVAVIEEIYGRSLGDAIDFARANPIRMVGGEVRSNTPRFVGLLARIYAAQGLHVFVTDRQDFSNTSTIFTWSFMTYLLGLSGGDYFTSSHGAPQKQSDKILAQDGAQYLPALYARIVEHLFSILDAIETDGYTIRLAALNDEHLHYSLTYTRMAKLYCNYLRKGPASNSALECIGKAQQAGLRLKLDFFGGAGGKTIGAILDELKISNVFEGGYIRAEEDPFFHNIGFRVAQKKNSDEYEVVHDSVDASLLNVVKSARYDLLLKDAPDGQMVFNVDPDSDRFVVGQVVPKSEKANLDRWGITSLELTPERIFAIYSPNQFFLMLAENDRVMAVEDGSWSNYNNFDVHTYVSALAWDEWAEKHGIPVVRVPVGFKEIAAIERQVEQSLRENPGASVQVKDELGNSIEIGSKPKLHHAGEESGGKIGGPREMIYNLLGEGVLGMREKSSGEACFSAVSLAARLWLKSQSAGPSAYFLHNYLETVFQESGIQHPMEFRGDIVHYNEAIFDPAELAKAKKEGIDERIVFNAFFTDLAQPKLNLDQQRTLLSEAMPAMSPEWQSLERIDRWSDGLQFWFKVGGKVRDLCLRPSGTDAKTKVYLDGTDKGYLQNLFDENFKNFVPTKSKQYLEWLG